MLMFMPFLIWTFFSNKHHTCGDFMAHLYMGLLAGGAAGFCLQHLIMAFKGWESFLMMDVNPSFLKTTLFKIVNLAGSTIIMALIATDLGNRP